MVHILHTSFSAPLPADRFTALLALLPPDMQQKVRSFHRWEDAQASLLGKVLLHKGASLFFRRKVILPDIRYSEYQRPFDPGGIEFNISHSGNQVVCALSDSCLLGIDLEAIRPLDLAVFREYMTQGEWAVIHGSEDPLRQFHRFWTRKESVVKALGAGLHISLQEVDVRESEVNAGGMRWRLLDLSFGETCCACLSADVPLVQVRQEAFFSDVHMEHLLMERPVDG